MSLSRPVKFPLLKLPYLCIEAVVKNWDILDIICFAFTSKRTRRIVRSFKIPLNGIKITDMKSIEFGGKSWHFRSTSSQSLVLQKNAIALYTSKTDFGLESYTDGNEFVALIMAMEFLNEVFKCSVKSVFILGDDIPESGDIGVKSTVNLSIFHTPGYAQSQKLNLFLENLEVTHFCAFWVRNTEEYFYCDPKLLKCKTLIFFADSAAWVTNEMIMIMQFEVPQLRFFGCPFSVEDLVSFVTQWFQSDNKKLEYWYICLQGRHFSLEKFQTEELNPSPFKGRNRVPSSDFLDSKDVSEGLEIVRHDGLQATIHVNGGVFLFYVWHNE